MHFQAINEVSTHSITKVIPDIAVSPSSSHSGGASITTKSLNDYGDSYKTKRKAGIVKKSTKDLIGKSLLKLYGVLQNCNNLMNAQIVITQVSV